MSEHFDPYHRWLGIPPKHQPPDYYRLLALERFEDDEEVIRDAAERQITHLRKYQLGEHAEAARKLLNELGRAKTCLLDNDKRRDYEAKLRSQDSNALSANGSPARPDQPATHPVSTTSLIDTNQSLDSTASRIKLKRSRHKPRTRASYHKRGAPVLQQHWMLLSIGAIAAFLVVVAFIITRIAGNTPKDRSKRFVEDSEMERGASSDVGQITGNKLRGDSSQDRTAEITNGTGDLVGTGVETSPKPMSNGTAKFGTHSERLQSIGTDFLEYARRLEDRVENTPADGPLKNYRNNQLGWLRREMAHLAVRIADQRDVKPLPADNYMLRLAGNYVVIPTFDFVSHSQFTIEANIRPEWNDGTLVDFFWGLLVLHEKDGKSILQCLANTSSSFNYDQYRSPLIHVAGCWDGKNTRIFVNGKNICDEVAKGQVKDWDLGCILGAHMNSSGIGESGARTDCFRGFIDEVRISSVARYASSFPPPPPADWQFTADDHTLALYHFDEGQGQYVFDSSGNGRHGVIAGSPYWLTMAEAERLLKPVQKVMPKPELEAVPKPPVKTPANPELKPAESAARPQEANWDDENVRFVECTAKSIIIHDGRVQHDVPKKKMRNSAEFLGLIEDVASSSNAMVLFLIRSDGVQTYRTAKLIADSNNARNGKFPLIGSGRIDFTETALWLPKPRAAPKGAKPVIFVCQHNKVYPLNVEELRKVAQDHAKTVVSKLQSSGKAVVDKEAFSEEFNGVFVSDGMFDAEVTVRGRSPWLVLTPCEDSGVTLDELADEQSHFRRNAANVNKKKFCGRFYVFADSFEIYLAARKVLDDAGMLADWEPQESNFKYSTAMGGPIQIGPVRAPAPKPSLKPANPADVID